MVSSGVIAKQLNEGALSNALFTFHKLTGILTLAVVLVRLCYRVLQWRQEARTQNHRRPILHWILYATIILVPLLGWAGVSAFGSREILPGFILPEIWPRNVAHSDVLLLLHAYAAFGLLALVALHIGVALQDYMMRSDDPERTGQ
jgi:cytochrome b561